MNTKTEKVLRWLAIVVAVLFAVAVGLSYLYGSQADAAEKGRVVGVTVDQNGEAIIFASEQPWQACKGGSAYKTGERVGCWVILDDEQMVFVMWKDGEMSNIPLWAVIPCGDAPTCKRAVVQ